MGTFAGLGYWLPDYLAAEPASDTADRRDGQNDGGVWLRACYLLFKRHRYFLLAAGGCFWYHPLPLYLPIDHDPEIKNCQSHPGLILCLFSMMLIFNI